MIIEVSAKTYLLSDREVWALPFDDCLMVICEDLHHPETYDFAADERVVVDTIVHAVPRGGLRYEEGSEAGIIAELRALGCWDLLDHEEFLEVEGLS